MGQFHIINGGDFMQYSDFPIIHAHASAGDPMFNKPYKGSLTDRERHLLGIAVAAVKGCSDCVGARLQCAIKAGIDMEIIQEMINLVAGYDAGYVISAVIRASKSAEVESCASHGK
jgi:AhpD family alkylhydroperoxidase